MYQNKNEQLLDRFEDWWRRDNHGLPLMDVIALKDNFQSQLKPPASVEEQYLGVDYLLSQVREQLDALLYLGDSYASVNANIGPGSLAVYLGAQPQFSPQTVWYVPCLPALEPRPVLRFDPENLWWKKHLAVLSALKAQANNDFLVNIPDLIENMDIYAAMRGTEAALLDMMDDPDTVQQIVSQIDDVYFRYYDAVLDIVKDSNGISSYTCFNILGKGRVAKIQCDFSAMISPQQFRQFVLPSLRKQVKRLDHTLYHLDGPDAIRHVPAIMELEELDALQWTCGAGQPDGACPRWYPIYDQVVAAGKGLWIQLYDGGVEDWIRSADKLMSRYGKKGFYFHFPLMCQADAEKLMRYAEIHWAD